MTTITSFFFFLLGLSSIFPVSFSTNILSLGKKNSDRLLSSVVFPLKGNVYPLGYYSVSINIGKGDEAFEFDIDSGSDLTWVQCDAPCTDCTKPREQLYKPNNNALNCFEPLCISLHPITNHHCKSADDQCQYEIEYADHGSSLGVLVNDHVPLKLTNGSLATPRIAFGCGYEHKYSVPDSPPPTAGVLGLGNGEVSFISQLSNMGVVRNVVGHCLSEEGGFLFFGDELVPSSGVTWTSMSHESIGGYYSSGPAEVYFGGKATGIKDLTLVFDSGSSYTYFNSQAYNSILALVRNNLRGKPLEDAPEDKSLPVCWKGPRPFKSLHDVKKYFNPLALRFTKTKKAQIQLAPEAYLIITKYGNVCFGILNGTEVGLGNLNIIGDISLKDKMVIYDNERRQIGWFPTNCNKFKKEGQSLCQPEGLFSILTENYQGYIRKIF
ncbi:aspartic proteinase Asp1 [Cucumis melo var. makuwa]|uniref:Aspartic proteinase Asp1 n=2 Tax=Cucumis melo TaxID=3656 RepID=A0A1S3CRY8_CUCME|nr:aspartic proteinase Asp1 isoform X1 [Cucumis melo]KAA0055449.1 aspartic proteinase Asp1 [Cucumis melo var. makuwa]TYK08931.1 aspartic proteinase Asp1 [Cucumis melo var. makuwa]